MSSRTNAKSKQVDSKPIEIQENDKSYYDEDDVVNFSRWSYKSLNFLDTNMTNRAFEEFKSFWIKSDDQVKFDSYRANSLQQEKLCDYLYKIGIRKYTSIIAGYVMAYRSCKDLDLITHFETMLPREL